MRGISASFQARTSGEAPLEPVATAAPAAAAALATATAATAAAATAAEATAAAAAAAEATAAALAFLRDVDADLAAIELSAVQLRDGGLRGLLVGHGDEGEAARPAAFTVGRKRDLAHLADGAERGLERSL
jgi:hypothetical protein